MDLTIRPGLASDVRAVLELWLAADAEPTHTDDVESVQRLIAHDPDALLVAEEGGQLVGSIIAGWDGWRGSIYRLVVAPSHRRHGLGRQLLAAAERRLRRSGAVRAQTFVVETDPQAVGFWATTDWHQQTERLRFVRG